MSKIVIRQKRTFIVEFCGVRPFLASTADRGQAFPGAIGRDWLAVRLQMLLPKRANWSDPGGRVRFSNGGLLSFYLECYYGRIGGSEMKQAERVTMDPDVCHGKPTIRGLRYPVETILELLSSGMTSDEILADYPDLEREDILAALNFATRLSQIKRVEPALG